MENNKQEIDAINQLAPSSPPRLLNGQRPLALPTPCWRLWLIQIMGKLLT
jgi:hypothetical protein